MKTNKYTVIVGVYSFNERRAELDIPLLERDGFEYEVELFCSECGAILANFDSQDGLQPFQVCHSHAKALQNAQQTQLEVESDIANGNINAWFSNIQACHCNKPRACKSCAQVTLTKRQE